MGSCRPLVLCPPVGPTARRVSRIRAALPTRTAATAHLPSVVVSMLASLNISLPHRLPPCSTAWLVVVDHPLSTDPSLPLGFVCVLPTTPPSPIEVSSTGPLLLWKIFALNAYVEFLCSSEQSLLILAYFISMMTLITHLVSLFM